MITKDNRKIQPIMIHHIRECWETNFLWNGHHQIKREKEKCMKQDLTAIQKAPSIQNTKQSNTESKAKVNGNEGKNWNSDDCKNCYTLHMQCQ